MHRRLLSALLFPFVLAGCGVPNRPADTRAAGAYAGPAAPLPVQPAGESTSSASAGGNRDGFAAFAPRGATVVDAVRGDLTGRNTSDVLIVFAPAGAASQTLGDGPPRTVTLLQRDASGQLRKASENARIVPCERCGGVVGDPYAYARIEAGTVTVSVAGGSRERWFYDYAFRYSHERATWLLDRVVRGVTDTRTRRKKRTELTAADFGDIGFADFDPATLPAPPAFD